MRSFDSSARIPCYLKGSYHFYKRFTSFSSNTFKYSTTKFRFQSNLNSSSLSLALLSLSLFLHLHFLNFFLSVCKYLILIDLFYMLQGNLKIIDPNLELDRFIISFDTVRYLMLYWTNADGSYISNLLYSLFFIFLIKRGKMIKLLTPC